MKNHLLERSLFVLLFMAMLPPAASAQMGSRPVPPGQSAANQATRQSEKVEAPAPAGQKITAAELNQQADALVALAQEVRADTQQATQGLLAKDLKDKLRRMEKLSKKLREELTE